MCWGGAAESRACCPGGRDVGGAWVPDSQVGMAWFLGQAEQGLPLTMNCKPLRKVTERKGKDQDSEGD